MRITPPFVALNCSSVQPSSRTNKSGKIGIKKYDREIMRLSKTPSCADRNENAILMLLKISLKFFCSIVCSSTPDFVDSLHGYSFSPGRSVMNNGTSMMTTRMGIWRTIAPLMPTNPMMVPRPAPPMIPPTAFDVNM